MADLAVDSRSEKDTNSCAVLDSYLNQSRNTLIWDTLLTVHAGSLAD
jgi:hypothetical protein